jgi:hypothetical protein
MEGRVGKVRVVRLRLQGLTKKAVSRNSKKCKLSDAQRQSAIDKFQAIPAGDVVAAEAAIQSVLSDRTNDVDSPPLCKRIHLFLSRKVTKMGKKARNQTRLA